VHFTYTILSNKPPRDPTEAS